MKSKRRNGSADLIDSLTAAALTRDMGEAVAIVRELGRGATPAPGLVREARSCSRRLRSVEQFRASLGLAPLGPAARLAV